MRTTYPVAVPKQDLDLSPHWHGPSNYDFIESINSWINVLDQRTGCEASVGLQDEGWLRELLYGVP